MWFAFCIQRRQHRRDELNEVEGICNDIGFFYQVEDDYNDCFGGVDVMKKGNDIAEGKCTWLAVKCLEIGSNADKAALKEFYGKNGKCESLYFLFLFLNLCHFCENTLRFEFY